MSRWMGLVLLALIGCLVSPGAAGAVEPALKGGAVAAPGAGVANLTGLLFAGFLVFFMQSGFALVETGMVRAKNVAHTMAMNLMVYCVGALGFWACGYAILEGDAQSLFLAGRSLDMGLLAWFLFQMMFMDTAATIPTGSMAERYRFSAFIALGFFVSMLLYPVYAHWVWGGGWLARLGATLGLGHGVVDYAGSSVVHMTGGLTALAGARALGPRIGKYRPSGVPNPLPAHNVPMYMLGTLVLSFGWFGFNCGSALAADDPIAARIAVNTILATAAGGFASMAYQSLRYRRPDPSFLCNGMLAGLVAVTAPCAYVPPWAAILIGGVAGVLVVWACLVLERTFRVDDPVGAVGVHAVGGTWGVLALGLFADGSYAPVSPFNGVAGPVAGLFFGDASQLLAQVVGVAVNLVWVLPLSYLFFRLTDRLIGNRVSTQVELQGLDVPELGALGYIHHDPKVPETRFVIEVPAEPRPAVAPPNGKKHFAVVVEGANPDRLAQVWSELCQPGDRFPSEDFLKVYRNMTTVKGNLFRFRGGDPEVVRASLQRLLQEQIREEKILARLQT